MSSDEAASSSSNAANASLAVAPQDEKKEHINIKVVSQVITTTH